MLLINQGPYLELLSMPLTEMGVGHASIEVPIEDKHLNPFGWVHGGVYASVIDTAAYWAAYAELPEDAGLVTLDLKVDNLSATSGKKLRARAHRIKAGRTIFLCAAEIFDETGSCLAHGTSKLLVTPGRQTIRELAARCGNTELPPKFC